jgi:hypothetical protein
VNEDTAITATVMAMIEISHLSYLLHILISEITS